MDQKELAHVSVGSAQMQCTVTLNLGRRGRLGESMIIAEYYSARH
jgi:hypothetical protein